MSGTGRRVVAPAAALAALLASACGTLATPAEPPRDLPDNHTGPFRELTNEESAGRQCVVVDFDGRVDDPSAVRLPDGTVAVYVARFRDGASTIARALVRDGIPPGALPATATDVLAPTQPWQRGAVGAPSVVAVAGGYAMAYASDGAIGVARSADGVAWTARDAPTFTGDPATGELTALAAPSLAVTAAGEAVLVYASAGAIWMARAPSPDGPYTRVDARPATPGRDPVLAAGDAAFEMGAVGDPSLSIETTAAGRALYRLYYTAWTTPTPMGDAGLVPVSAVGYAASFDGLAFSRVGVAVYAPRLASRAPTGPSMVPLAPNVTGLYVGAQCNLSRLRRGIQLLVAPATARLAPPPESGF